MKYLLLIIFILSLFNCTNSKFTYLKKPNQERNSYSLDTLNLAQGFRLNINEQRNIKNSDITIKLLDINDSRCPSKARCFQAGEVTVKILLTNHLKETIVVLTPIHKNKESINTITFNEFLITATEVLPYPRRKKIKRKNGYGLYTSSGTMVYFRIRNQY